MDRLPLPPLLQEGEGRPFIAWAPGGLGPVSCNVGLYSLLNYCKAK